MRAVGAQMMCLRNDVLLRGNGGDFLGFAVQQSAVRTGKCHRICSTDE